tara:strand:+ start:30 stop:326 length:297 start_codon:yes stop_codon:yes gene_type:complete
MQWRKWPLVTVIPERSSRLREFSPTGSCGEIGGRLDTRLAGVISPLRNNSEIFLLAVLSNARNNKNHNFFKKVSLIHLHIQKKHVLCNFRWRVLGAAQ